MDGQTDRFAISISRVSMLTRDKNCRSNWSISDLKKFDDIQTDKQTDRQDHLHYKLPGLQARGS